MQDTYWLKMLVKSLVLPPGGPLLVAIVGLALWRRRPKAARLLVSLGVISLVVLSLPVVSTLLASAFSAPAPFDPARASGAGAIVILGGGTRPYAPEYGGETLGRLTLERVRYGAFVARETKLPVLVTGGTTGGSRPEAVMMRETLAREFGIETRWAEPLSTNTHENAWNSSALLAADGIRKIVLVAHAFDMPRATAEFRDAGMTIVPAATGIPGALSEAEATDFLPAILALEHSYYTLYEMLAYLVYRITPR